MGLSETLTRLQMSPAPPQLAPSISASPPSPSLFLSSPTPPSLPSSKYDELYFAYLDTLEHPFTFKVYRACPRVLLPRGQPGAARALHRHHPLAPAAVVHRQQPAVHEEAVGERRRSPPPSTSSSCCSCTATTCW